MKFWKKRTKRQNIKVKMIFLIVHYLEMIQITLKCMIKRKKSIIQFLNLKLLKFFIENEVVFEPKEDNVFNEENLQNLYFDADISHLDRIKKE